MVKKLKQPFFMIVAVLFCISVFSGCSQPPAQSADEPFPYKDLTEEAYIKNAHERWEELIVYLDNSDAEDIDSALKAFGEIKGQPTQESIMALEMLMRFDEYLLETSGESIESIDAMGEEERAAFRKENQQKTEEQIPNAWKVQQDTIQKERDGKGYIGTYHFKNKTQITASENGTLSIEHLDP